MTDPATSLDGTLARMEQALDDLERPRAESPPVSDLLADIATSRYEIEDRQFETGKVTEIRRGSAHGATASIPGTSLSCDRPLRSPEDDEEWGPMTSLPPGGVLPGGAYDTPRPEGASAEWYTAAFRRRVRHDEQRAYDLLYGPPRQVQAAPVHSPVSLREAA